MTKLNKTAQLALSWVVSCVATMAIAGLMWTAYQGQSNALGTNDAVTRDAGANAASLLTLTKP